MREGVEKDRASDAEEGEEVTDRHYDTLTCRDTLDYLEAIGGFFKENIMTASSEGKYWEL